MPKQVGTYKVKGKMEGRSYYRPKYSEDHLLRSINPQMSERVKKDPAFATTRKYAAEFGVASGMSNEIFNVLNDYGCVINNPLYRSKLASLLLEFVNKDTEHPLGQRTLFGYNWQPSVQSFLNTCTRVPFTNIYPSDINLLYRNGTRLQPGRGRLSLQINTATQNNEYLRTKGIKNVKYNVYVFDFTAKKYIPRINQYVPTRVKLLSEIETFADDGEWGDTLNVHVDLPDSHQFVETPYSMLLALVVCNATRSTMADNDHLRSLNSFAIIPLGRVNGMIDAGSTDIAYIEHNGHRFINDDWAFIIDRDADPYITVKMNVADLEPLTNPTAKINGNSVAMVQLAPDLFRITLGVQQEGETMRLLSITSGTNTYRLELLDY